jgi:23S rRNA (cytosine1962-C5)-methyltransferase
MTQITLKANREKPLLQRQPWIFSGAIKSVKDYRTKGELCTVHSASGTLLGTGYYNDSSSIAVRMLSFADQPFSRATLESRLAAACDRRRTILCQTTNTCRLVNSEGDFLPGLVVDRFDSVLVLQLLTAGMELFREVIIDWLQANCSPVCIIERSDVEARRLEGLELAEGVVWGTAPQRIEVVENGVRYEVQPQVGQKTGFFADQRENRHLIRRYAPGKSVCDCFCYSGGFALNAAASGAGEITAVDSSASAIELAKTNLALNGFSAQCVVADIFAWMRTQESNYDVMVLDPPKFAKQRRDVERAARGYKDINMVAMKRVAPEGILFTFSCSQAIDPYLFRQIIFAAATDSGRQAQLLHVLDQPPDHPVNIAHREGEYLKGLVLRII